MASKMQCSDRKDKAIDGEEINTILMNFTLDQLRKRLESVSTADIKTYCEQVLAAVDEAYHQSKVRLVGNAKKLEKEMLEKLKEIRRKFWDDAKNAGSPISETITFVEELCEKWGLLSPKQREETLRKHVDDVKQQDQSNPEQREDTRGDNRDGANGDGDNGNGGNGIPTALLFVVAGISAAAIGVGIGLVVKGCMGLLAPHIATMATAKITMPIALGGFVAGVNAGGLAGNSGGGTAVTMIASATAAATVIATAPVTAPIAAVGAFVSGVGFALLGIKGLIFASNN